MIEPLARRRYRRLSTPVGIGQFDQLSDVQDPNPTIVANLIDSLTGQPGIRLAEPTGRRVYFGTGTTPQRFAATPSEINSLNQIRAGTRSAGMARRTLGKTRGLAPMGVPYAA